MSKKALITGCLGQDGSFLAEHLLSLGYEVFGFSRRNPQLVGWALPLIGKVEFIYGNLRDATAIETAIWKSWPDEIYNLAGQVFVPVSWSKPSETMDLNVGGLARILEVVDRVKRDTRVYQASSSEMYGNIDAVADEETPFRPVSPYGVSKLAAHHLVQVYRDRGLYVVGGILFNHESERRGLEMVTRKIARVVAGWACGQREVLQLGSLDSARDWGFAGDYVRAMWLMLQQKKPSDFVIGTGTMHKVRDFLSCAMDHLSLPPSTLESGLLEHDERMARSGDIRRLCAGPFRARSILDWTPQLDFRMLVGRMVDAEVERWKKRLQPQEAPR